MLWMLSLTIIGRGGLEKGLEGHFPVRAIKPRSSRTDKFCATLRAGGELIDGQFKSRAAAQIQGE
jgi:hypothetical protein